MDAPPNESRRSFLIAAGGATLASALAACTSTSTDPKTPELPPPASPPAGYNILLVIVDQERFLDRLPFPAPGRERLLREGISFVRHEANSNACTSSRAVMMTGLHMPQTEMFDNVGAWFPARLDPALGTLANLLGAAGYYAAYKGKWHLDVQLDAGTPQSLAHVPTPQFHDVLQGYGFADYDGVGDYVGRSRGGFQFDSMTTGHAISWLRETGRTLTSENKPWFLVVNLTNPHDVMYLDTDDPGQHQQWKGPVFPGRGISNFPTQPPDFALYRATWPSVPLPESRHQSFTEPGRPPGHLEYQKAQAELVGFVPDEDRRWRKLQDYYFNCIRDSDTYLVAMLEELDNLALREKTIVVFTSDHGELGGHHQMFGKGTNVYKEQMHVPLFVAHPAYPGGKQCNALSSHLDLAPTLLAMTGIPRDRQQTILGGRKGRDLTALFAAPEKADVHAVRDANLFTYAMILYADAKYAHDLFALLARTDLTPAQLNEQLAKLRPDLSKRSGIRCITDGDYKFARYFSLRKHNTPTTLEQLYANNDVELFNVRDDAEEVHNLAVDPKKNGELVAAMNAKLNALVDRELGKDDGSYLHLEERFP